MDKKAERADLVILGHIAKDVNEIDGVKVLATGGAVYYGGIAGRKMGLDVVIITRLQKKDNDILVELDQNDMIYYSYDAEETSGINNIYKSENMEYRICKPLGFAGLFKKEEIPMIETKYFVLAPILAGEIDISLLHYLSKQYPGKLCMDIQGFVRMIDKEKDEIYFCNLSHEDREKILSKIKILKLDRAEAKALTGKDEISEACKVLSDYGPDEILLTHDKGISLFAYGKYNFIPWKNKVLKGRTGRGDTAFISYVGSRISKTPLESLKFSIAMTSLKLETPGPFNEPLSKVYDLIKQEFS